MAVKLIPVPDNNIRRHQIRLLASSWIAAWLRLTGPHIKTTSV